MLLAQRCGYEFDSTTKSRGVAYLNEGRVALQRVGKRGATARVGGSRGISYAVEIDWSDVDEDVICARCTCPRYRNGYLCKHLWATLLALDEEGHWAQVPGRNTLNVVDFDDDSDLDDRWDGDDVGWGEEGWTVDVENDDEWDDEDDEDDDSWYGPRRAGLSRSTQVISTGGGPAAARSSGQLERIDPDSGRRGGDNWRRVLGHLSRPAAELVGQHDLVRSALQDGERIATYVINAAWSQEERELVLELAQQKRQADGTWGEVEPFSANQGGFAAFRDPVDRRILTWALDNELDVFETGPPLPGEAPTCALNIPAHDYDWLLPELAASGRLRWSLEGAYDLPSSHPVTWEEGFWTFRPRVVASADEPGWILDGVFVRGERIRPMAEAVLALETGLVLFEDGVSRLRGGDAIPLLRALRAGGPVRIPPEDQQDFLQSLYQLPYADAIELPGELRLPELEAAPQPLLRIKAPEHATYETARLYGEIYFLYGEVELPLADPRQRVVAPEKQCLLIRNWEREAARLAEIRELPVRLPAVFDLGPGEIRLDRSNLHEVLDALIERGWQVEAEGLLIRRPGDFNIQVQSNVDWFELQASVDYDGSIVQLPALLQALKNGEKYIRLDDGSQGMLPDEWLAKFEKFAELGEEDSDSIRFGRSQALLLDALLAQQENVRTDLTFRKFRDRLRKFRGIKPGKPPRGFQGELRDYQKAGLGWFKFLEEMGFGGCLADDMGLGKTIQVLGLLQHHRTRRLPKGQPRRPSLCVVPKSLVFNWIDEAERFTPRLRVVNYTGIDRKQRADELDEADLIVTTYGTLRRDIAELKDRRFDYVILDEAQAIKNSNSQAAKASRLLQAEHRLALTGTPIENHLGELWSLFEFINPGMLGNCKAFATLCRGVKSNGRGDGRNSQNGSSNGNGHSEALSDLSKAIAPFVLRRTKEQVLKELPEKMEQTIYCELSRKERKEYDELREYYRARLAKQIDDIGLQRSKFHVLEALLRLRQAACHPGLLDKKKTGQTSAKLEALLEQIREITSEGHKALVFSQFTSFLSIVRNRLDTEGITYEYLDGRTRKRKEHVQRFQTDPKCPLFLISLKAGGHGLNLTAADYVFILDPWWNPAVEAQAIDRSHRIGQSRRVFAYRLIAKDTVEEKVIELQQQKRELAEAIVSANESLIRKLTADDLQQILS